MDHRPTKLRIADGRMWSRGGRWTTDDRRGPGPAVGVDWALRPPDAAARSPSPENGFARHKHSDHSQATPASKDSRSLWPVQDAKES